MTKTNIKFKTLVGLATVSLFTVSCGQNQQTKIKKNDMLPKEIILNPKISKITDSIFIFKDGIKKLETVQILDLKNGILTHGHRKYFVNDTLNQTTNEKFDPNGNSIESHTVLHFKNSVQIFRRELDSHGNIIRLASEEDGRISHLEYKNVYRNNLLAESSVFSPVSGRTIEETKLEYDSRGNLIKEKYKESENVYEYNDDNKVTGYKHIKNGVVETKIIYHYNNKLLSKMEWYDSISPNPMITEYFYNSNNQLISEILRKYAEKTEYKNYDVNNNWQVKEQSSGGAINRLTKRTFVNR